MKTSFQVIIAMLVVLSSAMYADDKYHYLTVNNISCGAATMAFAIDPNNLTDHCFSKLYIISGKQDIAPKSSATVKFPKGCTYQVGVLGVPLSEADCATIAGSSDESNPQQLYYVNKGVFGACVCKKSLSEAFSF